MSTPEKDVPARAIALMGRLVDVINENDTSAVEDVSALISTAVFVTNGQPIDVSAIAETPSGKKVFVKFQITPVD